MNVLDKERLQQILNTYFNNRYRYVSSIGAGGMGSVYLIESNDNFRLQRALKIIEKDDQDTYGEIEALKDLNHPGIPKIIEVYETPEYIFIVQELVRGESLRTIIEENGLIDEKATLVWMSDIADILAYLHSMGFIHRDIKPGNIMITEDGDVKLIDFGLAKKLTTVDHIDTQVVGTRKYTAPERYDRRPADKRSDIYGFGCVCYYLATGEAPLEVTTNSQKPMRVMLKNLEKIENKGLRNIIETSLSINPDKRYQEFNEIRYNIKMLDAFNQAIEKKEKARKRTFFGIMLMFILSFITIASGFALNTYENNKHYEELIQQGSAYFDSNDLVQAKNTYVEAIDFNKKKLAGYQGLYETETKLGNYEGVVDGATELINNNANAAENANILYLLGNAYYELGEYDQAETQLKKAIELEPTVENHLVLGLTYSAQENYDQAQKVIDDLQAMGGDVNTSTYLSGQISVRQNKPDEAVNSFNQVINNTGDSSLKQRAVRSLSDLYRDENDYYNEAQVLEKIQSDPTLGNDYQLSEMLGEAYYNIAHNDGDTDYYTKALDEFNQLKDKGQNSPYIYRNIAIIYQELDEFDQARQTLDEMEEIYPEDASANIQKAWLILDEEGETEEANRDYSGFVDEYEAASQKDDGTNSGEIDQLADRYNELKEKGWLK